MASPPQSRSSEPVQENPFNSSDLFSGFAASSIGISQAERQPAIATRIETLDQAYHVITQLKAETHEKLRRSLSFHLTGGHKKLPTDALCNITWQHLCIDVRLDIEDILMKEQRRLAQKRLDANASPPDFDASSADVFEQEMSMKHQSMGAVQYYVSHTDDRSQLPVDKAMPSTRAWEIPFYAVDVAEPLTSISMEPRALVSASDSATCFNCGAPGHNVSGCSRPYDAARVRSARREWTDKRGDESRYWELQNCRIPAPNQFSPGSLSDRLKDALGMKENDVPPYYWRMQVSGYPPGYLLPIALNKSTSADQNLQIYNDAGDYSGKAEVDNQAEQIDAESLLVPFVFFPGLTITPRMLQIAARSIKASAENISTHNARPLAIDSRRSPRSRSQERVSPERRHSMSPPSKRRKYEEFSPVVKSDAAMSQRRIDEYGQMDMPRVTRIDTGCLSMVGVVNQSDAALAPLSTDDPLYAQKRAAADKFWSELKRVSAERRASLQQGGQDLDMEIE